LGEYIVLKSENSLRLLYDFLCTEANERFFCRNVKFCKDNTIKINRRKRYKFIKKLSEFFIMEKIRETVEIMCCTNNIIENACILDEKINTTKIDYIALDLQDKILNMEKNVKKLNCEGIKTFLMPEYNEEIEYIAEEIFSDMQAEEDVDDFLDLLKFYSDTKIYYFGILNVVIQNNNTYRYFNDRRTEITNEVLNEFYAEFNDKDAMDDDILLSIIILKLPCKIIFHGKIADSQKEFFEILKEVFKDRITICNEKRCGLCNM